MVNPFDIDLGDVATSLEAHEMHWPGTETGDVHGELVFDKVDSPGFVADLLVDAEEVWCSVTWAVVLDTVGGEKDITVDLKVV